MNALSDEVPVSKRYSTAWALRLHELSRPVGVLRLCPAFEPNACDTSRDGPVKSAFSITTGSDIVCSIAAIALTQLSCWRGLTVRCKLSLSIRPAVKTC
jgi:hypothetical protein